MIRILRAPHGAGVTDEAWARAASVWSGDHAGFARALAARATTLQGAEADAVRSATRELAPLESADVLIAAGGAIFRVIPRQQSAEPVPLAVVDAGKGFTSFPGAVVLLLSAGDERDVRLATALRFVGYDARLADATDALSAIASVVRTAPRIVVAGAGFLGALEPGWLARARETSSFALVSVGGKRGGLADATIEVPVRLESVADVLDPLLEAAARTRSA